MRYLSAAARRLRGALAIDADDGLWLFITVTVASVAGLVYDAILWQYGYTTITAFCRRHFWAAAMIVTWNASGLFGLAVHLTAKNGKGG